MEWWSLFFNIRKLIFAFIAVTSLLWAIAVSVYISREWHHFMIFQRILVLAVIGINGLSTLLLYLMIVVVFRVWLDLARMLFLLLIHAGAAVMLTLFGHNFSCDIFDGNDSTKICKDVDLAFIIGSWAMTGLSKKLLCFLINELLICMPV
ncbi:hypothetical protein EW026_g2762 [Hermanssonia centrifuga]|uniref:Uncharacterized protein n=1 Tax=Hermanssonia centrifuga TaxID=98765 RepID=A0A4S4KNB9_9APHY|nr:hypothetical protein EW026_g2762 [Hermanssonia centrifuga]